MIATPRVFCFLFGSQDFLACASLLGLWLSLFHLFHFYLPFCLHPRTQNYCTFTSRQKQTRELSAGKMTTDQGELPKLRRESVSLGDAGDSDSHGTCAQLGKHFQPVGISFLPCAPPTRSARGRMTQFQSWPLTPPNVYIPCTSIITAATHPTPRDLHRGMPMLKSSLVFILVSDSLLKT